MIDLTSKQLRRAAAIKEKIQALEKQLTRLLGANEAPSSPRKQRHLSAAARARIAAAQRARWAKFKARRK
jgi:hypothetical protein